MINTTRHQTSVLEPLKVPTFRMIWFAAVLSNTGFFVQDLGAAWLMTSLSNKPMMVALLQTAAVSPFFLLGLASGAIADIVDRRKLILAGQIWMMFAATALAFITFTGHASAWILLTYTFILFLGNAAISPAWNAVFPSLVPKQHMEQAIGLGAAGYNVARGVGAALGGLVVAVLGTGFCFLINAVCYVAMIVGLWRWDYKPDTKSNEKLGDAIRAGLRYVSHSRVLRAVLAKTVLFTGAVSILWSLVPLLAREQLHVTSFQYGIMVGAFGGGALLGAIILAPMRRHMSLDTLSQTGTALFALSFLGLAFAHNFFVGFLCMLGCGVGWTAKVAALGVAVQLAAPNWVRARAYSVYMVVWQACTASTALFWGALATYVGLSMSFLVAAGALGIGLVVNTLYTLSHAEDLDVSEATNWDDAELNHTVPSEAEGPIMVTVEYVIDPNQAQEFQEAMQQLGAQRRRDGALQWNFFRDLADETRFCETFMVDTWGDHMRQLERGVVSDRKVEQHVQSFHKGESPPKVHHYMASLIRTKHNESISGNICPTDNDK